MHGSRRSGRCATSRRDRPQVWIESNIDAFRFVLHPVLDRVRASEPNPAVTVGSRLTALQMGAVLGWLSGKCSVSTRALVFTGQTPRLMDCPEHRPRGADAGCRSARLSTRVCLHEETHRVQFTTVPWLSDYFRIRRPTLVAAIDVPSSELLSKSGQLLGAVMQVLRAQRERRPFCFQFVADSA